MDDIKKELREKVEHIVYHKVWNDEYKVEKLTTLYTEMVEGEIKTAIDRTFAYLSLLLFRKD